MNMEIALRELGGEGPVEVLLRAKDFNIQTLEGPNGPVTVPSDTLVAFMAGSFRELGESSGVWEFTTNSPLAGGGVSRHRLYVRVPDILMMRAPSKVAL